MSITIGIYDLFSYLIPGILYLYVANQFLGLFNKGLFDVLPKTSSGYSIPDLILVVLGFVAAFIVGHIFDLIARWFVFRLIYRDKTSQTVLVNIKKRDADANIQFEAKDWHLLLVLLRQRNLQVAQSFDKHEADSIMFRNISLIALLLGLISIARAILENPMFWILAVLGLIVCIMTARRSYTFHTWFFEGVFLAALEYGNTVDTVIEYNKKDKSERSPRSSASSKKPKDK